MQGKKNIQDAVLGSNVALANWGHNLLRKKGCRIGIEFCFLLDVCLLVTHMEVCLLWEISL